MGKTALALNIVQHAAIEHNTGVAFFSIEMSKDALVQRCSARRVWSTRSGCAAASSGMTTIRNWRVPRACWHRADLDRRLPVPDTAGHAVEGTPVKAEHDIAS